MKTYEFGTTSDGRTVHAYVLENEHGTRAEFLDYGCILRQLWVLKADDSYVNIVHGLDSVSEYEKDGSWFGAFIGRFANRIKDSRFELNGKEYRLEPNDGPNHLHGPWGKTLFQAQELPADSLEESSRGVVFTYHSPDGEDGFPGNVDVKVTYILDERNVLHMDYEAVSDQDTIMNLTNHSYFHLGAGQIITVNADQCLEIDDQTIIPTGRILSVADHPVMDLRSGKDVETEYPPMGFFDHCFVLNEKTEEKPDVTVYAPGRGITLELRTSEPAVQIYSGNPVGVAIESQMYPCAPNYPQFPSCLVKAGQTRHWKNALRIIVER